MSNRYDFILLNQKLIISKPSTSMFGCSEKIVISFYFLKFKTITVNTALFMYIFLIFNTGISSWFIVCITSLWMSLVTWKMTFGKQTALPAQEAHWAWNDHWRLGGLVLSGNWSEVDIPAVAGARFWLIKQTFSFSAGSVNYHV